MCTAFFLSYSINHSAKLFLALLFITLLSWPNPVAAQSVGPSGCVKASGTCGNVGGSSGGGGGPTGKMHYRGPSGHAAQSNKNGVVAYNKQDYYEAAGQFSMALHNRPNETVYRKNYRNSLNQIGLLATKRKAYESALIFLNAHLMPMMATLSEKTSLLRKLLLTIEVKPAAFAKRHC